MVADELNRIRARMAAAADRAGRNPDDVTLVAVSKGQSEEAILAAYKAGQRNFGENRAAELAAKAPRLPVDIIWHFIGTLQTRQAKIALPHTNLLHSLDRPRLVNSWAAGEQRSPVLIQVNVAGEQQKHGIAPSETAGFLELAIAGGLDCVGLMTIPPLATDDQANREIFDQLRRLRDRLAVGHRGLVELSMGMTDDFETAIEEGATMIRVGRAIFGPPGVPARSN